MADYKQVKALVSEDQAIARLNLIMTKKGNQWRSPCPRCEGSAPRALCVTEGKGFYCWASHAKGSIVDLAAHILGISAPQAANFLMGTVGTVPGTVGTSTRGTVPESECGKAATRAFQPLPYLEAEHPAVDAIGFDPEFAKKVGIGFAGKGILRGTVAVPVRDENGDLLGYIGIQEATLPPSFTTNVVAFPKTA